MDKISKHKFFTPDVLRLLAVGIVIEIMFIYELIIIGSLIIAMIIFSLGAISLLTMENKKKGMLRASIPFFPMLIATLFVIASIGVELAIGSGHIILVMQAFTIIYLGVVYYVVAHKYLRKNTQRMI